MTKRLERDATSPPATEAQNSSPSKSALSEAEAPKEESPKSEADEAAQTSSESALETADPPKPTPGSTGKKRKKRLPLLLRFLIKLVVLSGILIAAFTYVLGVRIYHGNQMHPFIMDGDLLITYKLDDYHSGDVVAYRNPNTGETSISRIVAVGEKEIEITELGALLVDGYSPSEQVFYPTKPLEGSEITFPYHMTQDGYFLLDDYREIGKDSRAFGQVSREALLGKVVYVLRRRGI